MKLKLFEVHSYRSCLKTKFNLNPKLTALIGVNGAGKSNILNALLLLKKVCPQRVSQAGDSDAPYNSCMVRADVLYGKKLVAIRTKIRFETDEHNLDDIQSSKIEWNFEPYTAQSKWILVPGECHNFFHHNILSNNWSNHHISPFFERLMRREFLVKTKEEFNDWYVAISKNSKAIAKITAFFSDVSYYSASQFSDPSRCPVAIEMEDNRPIRRYRANVRHEQFIKDLYNLWKSKSPQYNRYITTVDKESGIGLIESIDFTEVDIPSSSYKVEIGGKIKKITKTKQLIVPRFKVDGNELSPNQLSEGTFKTLALLFYVLTDSSSLLLIEEPEVCIHHGLLNSIMELIKAQSRHKQIIVSTHSDFVLDKLKPENLLLVERKSRLGTVAAPLNKVLTENDYCALREYLESTGNLGEYWRDSGFIND